MEPIFPPTHKEELRDFEGPIEFLLFFQARIFPKCSRVPGYLLTFNEIESVVYMGVELVFRYIRPRGYESLHKALLEFFLNGVKRHLARNEELPPLYTPLITLFRCGKDLQNHGGDSSKWGTTSG
jgi:hypothetical protein